MERQRSRRCAPRPAARTPEADRRASETKREFFEKERGAQQIANELRAQGKEAAAEFLEQAEAALRLDRITPHIDKKLPPESHVPQFTDSQPVGGVARVGQLQRDVLRAHRRILPRCARRRRAACHGLGR